MINRPCLFHYYYFTLLIVFNTSVIIIIIIIIIITWSFSHQCSQMVFHLSDSKFPQVYRILLSIQADLNNAVVWIVSTCPLISKSSSPFIHSAVTVPKAPTKILLLLLLLLCHSLRDFHTSVNWWFSTRVWVTASLLESPGLVSVFCPTLIML